MIFLEVKKPLNLGFRFYFVFPPTESVPLRHVRQAIGPEHFDKNSILN